MIHSVSPVIVTAILLTETGFFEFLIMKAGSTAMLDCKFGNGIWQFYFSI